MSPPAAPSPHRAQVASALEAVRIRSLGDASWRDEPIHQLEPDALASIEPSAARALLVQRLQAELYGRFYTQGGAVDRPPQAGALGETLVPALQAANSGRGCLQSGWEVRAVGPTHLTLRRHGMEMVARLEDCVPPARHRVGMKVKVRTYRELLRLSPGFYMALGDAEGIDDAPTDRLVRVYFALTAAGGVKLMRAGTRILNQAGVPFRLKVLSDPSGYSRADSGVLYFRRQDARRVLDLLPSIHLELTGELRPLAPALTKPLGLGLGLAEDPGPGESFGQHRCRLLAEALVLAHERGADAPDARMAAAEERFREAGLDLDAPYLNAGSRDDYAYREPPVAPAPGTPGSALARPVASEECLGVALALARRLSHDAFRHGERCGWFGPAFDHTRPLGPGGLAVLHSACAADLYSGTAGIALFLGETAALTGDADLARTARAAAWNALEQAHRLPEAGARGLHGGASGAAYAAVRVGRLLRDDALVDAALDALLRLPAEPPSQETDVISGTAGAILALVACSGGRRSEEILALAERMGDQLLAAGVRGPHGLSWPSPGMANTHDLTGYSHGAAGNAHALWELHAATGQARFADAARDAFRYEDAWLDRAKGNWPDFRPDAQGRPRPESDRQFAAFWCHGAPGIALARLDAYSISKEEEWLADARLALRTTREAVRENLALPTRNFSLCHGLCGNAETLLDALPHLDGEERDLARAAVQDVARAAIDEVLARGAPWPCAIPGHEPQGLMLGLAGIGLFHLRVHRPAVPSALHLRAGQAWRPVDP